MIIDSKNETQKSILTNKCFYQTTAQIMHEFEKKGYANSADETAKVIAAYHDLVQKKAKPNYANTDKYPRPKRSGFFLCIRPASIGFAFLGFRATTYWLVLARRERTFFSC